MTYLSDNKNVGEEEVRIRDIPCIVLKPRGEEGKIPTVILYHGWGSNKESQKFRGFILASLGYQVVIPDAIHHGQRNPIDYYDIDVVGQKFWKVILRNVEESRYIIEEVISKYNGDPDNIGVMGHSMGGFTTAGIFTHDKRIKTGIVLNGSFNWKRSNELFVKDIGEDIVIDEEDEIIRLDPMNNFEKLVDRPILMLNGGADKVVPIAPQRAFYDKIKKSYRDQSNIEIIKYNALGHFVSTNMMEDAANWLKIHLG